MTRSQFIKFVRKALPALLVALISLMGIGGRSAVVLAAGNTYVVNSTADLPDADQGDGICLTASGTCTLRAAIMQANYLIGPDTITLPAGLYKLTRVGDDDIAVLGDLDITDDVTIQGAGSGVTIVDGNGVVTGDRVFQITASAKATSFNGLTIRNGKKDANAFDQGGGLYWDGAGSQLHFTNVVIENNASRYGGGLYLNYSTTGDTVSFDHVVVRGNSAAAAAGGLAVNFGDGAGFAMLNSRVYNNKAYEGGGIYFQGTTTYGLSSVSIENSQIYSNTASLSAGFENHSGDATVPIKVLNTDLYQNHADYYGGAIGNYGTLAVFTTTVDANSAVVRGGGIYNYEGGHLDINQSTLSDNLAQFGGGIYSELFIHNNAALTMTNSTLSGNTASRDGGGIYAVGGHISLFNTTIARNLVLVPTNVVYTGLGGGVYITATATVSVLDTLFGDNTHTYQALLPEQDDCFGTVDSQGFNLIEQTTNCTISGITTGNITGLDPRLGPLQNYGGPTKTLAPYSGSPVIDAGQTPYCTDVNGAPLSTDQRGIQRPLGAGCDIGSVESFPYSLYLPDVKK